MFAVFCTVYHGYVNITAWTHRDKKVWGADSPAKAPRRKKSTSIGCEWKKRAQSNLDGKKRIEKVWKARGKYFIYVNLMSELRTAAVSLWLHTDLMFLSAALFHLLNDEWRSSQTARVCHDLFIRSLLLFSVTFIFCFSSTQWLSRHSRARTMPIATTSDKVDTQSTTLGPELGRRRQRHSCSTSACAMHWQNEQTNPATLLLSSPLGLNM